MIKKLLFSGLTFVVLNSYAQSFSIVYNFAAVVQASPATQNSVDPTPTPTATGINCGSFVAVVTGTGSTGGGRFSFTDWPTGAVAGNDTYSAHTGSIDVSKYYEVTLTPQNDYLVDFTSMSVRIQRSGTGIRTYAVRGSMDSYASNLPGTVTTGTLLSVQAGDIFYWGADAVTSGQNGTQITFPASYSAVPAGNPVTLRFYGWNAEGNAGTFSIDSVHIMGTATFTVGAGLNKLSHDLGASFKLYPNPSHDGIVYVDSKIDYSKVELINLLGTVVASQNNRGEEKVKIDVSTFPAGTYFVRIHNGKKVVTEKLVITK